MTISVRTTRINSCYKDHLNIERNTILENVFF